MYWSRPQLPKFLFQKKSIFFQKMFISTSFASFTSLLTLKFMRSQKQPIKASLVSIICDHNFGCFPSGMACWNLGSWFCSCPYEKEPSKSQLSLSAQTTLSGICQYDKSMGMCRFSLVMIELVWRPQSERSDRTNA